MPQWNSAQVGTFIARTWRPSRPLTGVFANVVARVLVVPRCRRMAAILGAVAVPTYEDGLFRIPVSFCQNRRRVVAGPDRRTPSEPILP